MHVLTVLDHPNPKSFSHAVARRFMEGAEAAGHTVELADLHAEGFNPVWQMGDFREDAATALPEDVQAEQARLERADALALVFPLWWWGMPSVLKGWIDRVFAWGWAYDQLEDDSAEASMLPLRPCVMLVPAGASPQNMTDGGFMTALEDIWLKGTLNYFGMKDPVLHMLHGSTGKPERRVAHLEAAYHAGRTIAGATAPAG